MSHRGCAGPASRMDGFDILRLMLVRCSAKLDDLPAFRLGPAAAANSRIALACANAQTRAGNWLSLIDSARAR